MEIVKGLGQILPQSVPMPLPGVHWEQRDMLKVNSDTFPDQEYSQSSFVESTSRLEDDFILFPGITGDCQFLLAQSLGLSHRSCVYQFSAEFRRSASGHPGPDAETVLLPFTDTYSEIALILEARPLVGVARIGDADVMGIPFKGAVVLYRHLSESLPSLKMVVWIFKRTVLDQLRIEAAIGREVDVLEEYAVLGRLDGRSLLLKVDVHYE